MKKLLFIAAIAMLLSACSGNASDKSANKNNDNSITFTNDMENAAAKIPSWTNEYTVNEGIAHSGKFSSYLDETREYSYNFSDKLSSISNKLPKRIEVKAWIYSTVANPDASIIAAIDNNGKSIYWNSAVLKPDVTKANEWTQVTYMFDINKPVSLNDKVTVVLWNLNKLKLYCDDITVTFHY